MSVSPRNASRCCLLNRSFNANIKPGLPVAGSDDHVCGRAEKERALCSLAACRKMSAVSELPRRTQVVFGVGNPDADIICGAKHRGGERPGGGLSGPPD